MNGHTEQTDIYAVQIKRGLGGVYHPAVFWFHRGEFLQSQPCGEPVCFSLLHRKTGQVAASFLLYEKDGNGVSPCRAPFGSVQVASPLPFVALDVLLKSVNTFANREGLRKIRITSYPFCYAPDVSALLTACFTANGYAIATTDLNFHIPVTEAQLEARMHPSERRRLRKCLEAGLQFIEEQEPDLAGIYQFVTSCRQRRGFPVTLHYADFEALFRDFPGNYRLFTVKDRESTAALAVGVRVSPDILYYFYPADDPAYKTYSPTVLLLHGMYAYAWSNGYSLLDLGIATDRGEPNEGLIRFKRNMGGEASLKLTFQKAFFTDG